MRTLLIIIVASSLHAQNLEWKQLRSDNRRGAATAGNIGQSACGTTTSAHVGSFDSNGCLIDAGAPTITINGQTCTLFGSCNVNAGDAAHSVALNEGNGSQLGAAIIGTAGRVFIDQGAGADPAFEAISTDATLSSAGSLQVVNGSHITNSSIPNSGLVNTATTPNGQTCTLGSTCNVNGGAAAHSMALNQGPGAAISGLVLGAHQVPVGTTASDPNAKTVPDCTDSSGNHLNFTQSTDAWSCGTSAGTPSGSAGGDLSGTYPNPTVAKVDGVSYPSGPSTHTVPVITASNTATYKSVPDCTDTSGNHLNYTQSTDSFSCGTTNSASAQLHSITFGADGGGSVITTGDLGFYIPVDFACTIIRYDISASPSGSITVDVWKAATAIPTSGNKISSSAPMTLSSAQLSQNGSRTGWTNSVSSGDVFGFSVATVSTITKFTGIIWCN